MSTGEGLTSLSSINLEENDKVDRESTAGLVEAPRERTVSPLARFVGSKVGMDEDGRKIDKDGNEVYDFNRALNKAEVMSYARAVRKRGSYHKVEPGDDDPKATLFPIWSTSVDDLEGFGLGVVLYFKTLTIMGCLMIVCLFLNGWTIGYFASDKYSGGYQEKSNLAAMFPGDLVGSAFCPTERQINFNMTNGQSGNLHLCPFNSTQAWLDLGTSIFLLLVILIIGKVQGEQAEAIDESVQTSQDYSVEIEDPGDSEKDNDPKEWVRFFGQFGRVTAVALAKKNGKLMRLLCDRRALLRKVDLEGWAQPNDPDYVEEAIREHIIAGKVYPLPEGETHFSGLGEGEQVPARLPALGDEDMPAWKSAAQKAGLFRDVKFLVRKIGALNAVINDEIKVLSEQIKAKGHVDNARVFVTYNLETDQRKCINALSTGSMWAFLDLPKPWFIRRALEYFDIMEEAPLGDHFHGNVLKVTLAPEPTDVRWENLDVEPIEVAAESTIFTMIGFAVIVVLSTIIKSISDAEPTLAGFFISVCNGVLPSIMKLLNSFERHPTNTESQASLLFKLVAARWTVSAMVVYVITPWTETLDGERIKGVMAILIADAITTPIIRLLNVGPNINRYILAPMAHTQQQLEDLLKGAPWFLAERYSDMTKTIYICLFYSAILPSGYLVTTVALFINYWVDKFCLLRYWQVPPKLDASITATTRSHMAMVIIIHCIISLHYYAGWPFDNIVCRNADGDLRHDARCAFDDTYTTERVSTNVWQHGSFIIFYSRGFMTQEQSHVVASYQVLTLIAVIIVSVVYFGQNIFGMLYSIFVGVLPDTTDPAVRPKSKKDDNGIYFVQEEQLKNTPTIKVSGEERHLIEASTIELEAYVPQISHSGLEVPQIAIYHPDMVMKKPSEEWSTTGSHFDMEKSWFPAEMMSWNENAKYGVFFYDNNLYMDPILDQVKEEDRIKMFSSFHVIETDRAALQEAATEGQL